MNPPPESYRRTAHIEKKSEFVGVGALVQLIGVICFFLFFPFGVILGILLLIVGGRMAIVRVCSACRGKVDREASLCQHCRADFGERRSEY